MVQEKNYKAASGYGMIALAVACMGAFILFVTKEQPFYGIPFILAFPFIARGIFIMNPNEAKVLTLFG